LISCAFYAAVAGDLEAVAEYRASAATAPANGWQVGDITLFWDCQITALLGDPQAAWAMIVPILGNRLNGVTVHMMALHPEMRYLYSDAPGYQEAYGRLRQVTTPQMTLGV